MEVPNVVCHKSSPDVTEGISKNMDRNEDGDEFWPSHAWLGIGIGKKGAPSPFALKDDAVASEAGVSEKLEVMEDTVSGGGKRWTCCYGPENQAR